jgi:hypothetical protein
MLVILPIDPFSDGPIYCRSFKSQLTKTRKAQASGNYVILDLCLKSASHFTMTRMHHGSAR